MEGARLMFGDGKSFLTSLAVQSKIPTSLSNSRIWSLTYSDQTKTILEMPCTSRLETPTEDSLSRGTWLQDGINLPSTTYTRFAGLQDISKVEDVKWTKTTTSTLDFHSSEVRQSSCSLIVNLLIKCARRMKSRSSAWSFSSFAMRAECQKQLSSSSSSA